MTEETLTQDVKLEPKNLIHGLQDEMNRVRGIIKIYDDLPDGAGNMGIALMKASIARAEKSIGDGDAVDMLNCLGDLKEYKT